MQLVYGFIEEPRLLLHGGGGGGGGQHSQVHPTSLARQLANTQPGLLVAAMVALHENCKVQLEQADFVFKVCILDREAENYYGNQILVFILLLSLFFFC